MDHETLDEIKRHFGIVVEDVRSDVRGVAEGLGALSDKVDRELGEVRRDLGTTREELGSQIGAVREEMGSQIGAVREELGSQIGAVREELGSQIGAVREELGSQIGAMREELRSEIVAVGDELGTRTQAVADDGQALRAELGEFRGNVAEEFEETRALVRLSYGQLDRRVRTLETEMADLRERLERVEGHIAG